MTLIFVDIPSKMSMKNSPAIDLHWGWIYWSPRKWQNLLNFLQGYKPNWWLGPAIMRPDITSSENQIVMRGNGFTWWSMLGRVTGRNTWGILPTFGNIFFYFNRRFISSILIGRKTGTKPLPMHFSKSFKDQMLDWCISELFNETLSVLRHIKPLGSR